MALADPYATLAQLKKYLLGQLAAGDTVDDDELTDALNAVSRQIDHDCGRQFNDAGSVSARLFGRARILDGTAWVDDFSTDTGLIVATDDADDGNYSTTWDSTDFQLEPLNGLVDGESGWPFHRIVPVADKEIPRHTRRAPLRVTAKWGWAAVPAPVKQATLILAAETHKLRSAPFGVAGFDGFGVVRVRDNPMAHRKLSPYMLEPVLVA